jgi:hypothetical protein
MSLRDSGGSGKPGPRRAKLEAIIQGDDVERWPPQGQDRALQSFLDRLNILRKAPMKPMPADARRKLGAYLIDQAKLLNEEACVAADPVAARRKRALDVVKAVRGAATAVALARRAIEALDQDPFVFVTLFGRDDGEGPTAKDCAAYEKHLNQIYTSLDNAARHAEAVGEFGRSAQRRSGARIAESRGKDPLAGKPAEMWKQSAAITVAVVFKRAELIGRISDRTNSEFGKLVNVFATGIAGCPEIGESALEGGLKAFREAEGLAPSTD